MDNNYEDTALTCMLRGKKPKKQTFHKTPLAIFKGVVRAIVEGDFEPIKNDKNENDKI